MPDYVRENAPDIGMLSEYHLMLGSQKARHALLEQAFIELRVAEGDRKGVQLVIRVIADDCSGRG